MGDPADLADRLQLIAEESTDSHTIGRLVALIEELAAPPTLDAITTTIRAHRAALLPPVTITKVEVAPDAWDHLKADAAQDPTWAASPPGVVVRQLLTSPAVFVEPDLPAGAIVIHHRLSKP